MADITILSAMAKFAFTALSGMRENDKDPIKSGSAIADINARSLLELGQVTEVEAVTVVDTALTMHESTTDVLKFANTIYASHYLSAASVLTDTGRIKTVQLLAKLNPSKSPTYAVANGILSAAEKAWEQRTVSTASIDISTESLALNPSLAPARLPRTVSEMTVSMEAVAAANESSDKDDKQQNNPKTSKPGQVNSFRNGSDLATVANLSVGQAVTLNVTDGEASKDVVVNIRLVTVPVSKRIMNTLLKWSNKDARLFPRLTMWRAGELRFWRDVVFMRDIFTERQRLLMDDKSDLFKTMLGRQRNSMINSVLTATPDVGNLSSILVISEDTLASIEETDLDGKISNFSFRQRVMNNTGLVLLIVVDPLSELVTIYNHLSALPTECSIRQMKAASKGGASDFGELIKLMNQNKMPTF